MSALDMTGNYSVLLICSSVCVKRFEHLHKSVALEKAKTNIGSWQVAREQLHKVTLVLVLDFEGYTIQELKSEYEEARDIEKPSYAINFRDVEKPSLVDVRRIALLSRPQLAEKAHVDIKTINKAEKGLPILEIKALAIIKALNDALNVEYRLDDIADLAVR